MIIVTALNNNMAIVKGKNDVEKIVTGKGIAFQKKKGDPIDLSKIEKQFDLVEKGIGFKTKNIIESVPKIYFQICDEIITIAKDKLNTNLDDMILISLADHISYAVTRQDKNQILTSTVDWEIRHFYPEEFELGKIAIEIVEKRLNVRLDESEAVYIAFHLINAQSSESQDVKKQMTLLYDILRLIQFNFKLELNPDSLMYTRLVNHLKYLCHKINNNIYEETFSIISLEELETKYPEEVNCVKKIELMVEKQYSYKLSESDKVYLVMHIFRIIL